MCLVFFFLWQLPMVTDIYSKKYITSKPHKQVIIAHKWSQKSFSTHNAILSQRPSPFKYSSMVSKQRSAWHWNKSRYMNNVQVVVVSICEIAVQFTIKFFLAHNYEIYLDLVVSSVTTIKRRPRISQPEILDSLTIAHWLSMGSIILDEMMH